MKGLDLIHIAEACGGILVVPDGDQAKETTEVTSVETDSRRAHAGCLFAAIKGERADGHSFIDQVFQAGAACVLTEEDLSMRDNAGSYPAWIKVRSTLEALKGIAAYYLRVMNIPVVGITGSVGKTSTKEMIASVLSVRYNVLKTAGNFNNELGLPLTVFRIREEHEIAVLEMGINHFGEMHRLAGIARPDICVITNIGECHLEFLGDRDGVLQAKTEIFDFLEDDACIVLNGSDDKLATVRNVKGISPVFYAVEGSALQGIAPEVSACNIAPFGLEGTEFTIHCPAGSFRAKLHVPGEHMVMNALAACAVALKLGLTTEEIQKGIENYRSVDGRLNIISTGRYTLIDDCYNANPVSVRAALRTLAQSRSRKVAVLGDMFELGPDELKMHAGTGEDAAKAGINVLIAIGARSRAMADAAGACLKKEGRSDMQVVWYETLQEAMPHLTGPQLLKAGDAILIKASHGMEFRKIVEALLSE